MQFGDRSRAKTSGIPFPPRVVTLVAVGILFCFAGFELRGNALPWLHRSSSAVWLALTALGATSGVAWTYFGGPREVQTGTTACSAALLLSDSEFLRLRSIEGWIELGDLDTALTELEALPQSLQGHPCVLVLRYRIHYSRQDWATALTFSQALMNALPDEPAAWLNHSLVLDALGRASEAQKVLSKAFALFPGSLFPP